MAGSMRPLASAKMRIPTIRGLTRERVLLTLDRIWDHRLGLVLAPPGAGKTTALAQYAGSVDIPVAWYRAEATDGDAGVMIAYLARALGDVLNQPTAGQTDVESLADALEGSAATTVLLVIDDLHMLEGTEAEGELERLIELAPPCLHILAASRRAPAFNLSRLRVAGDLLEVDAGDLRFRSWEVEQLFGSVYGEPLPPEELAQLSRRTEGWAAGLQLFHLATVGKPVAERRRAVSSLVSGSRLVRAYLARNVLEDMPPDLRTFLTETSVLGRLSPELCDRLRDTTGSLELLDEVARRQFFLMPLDEPDAYRVHEVLRSHLEALLLGAVGPAEALRRYARAGQLLEDAGAVPEALLAYSRAGRSADASRLLGDRGARLGAEPGNWLEMLPAEMADHDPWLVLARARHAEADGRLATAINAYQRAEDQFGALPAADVARRARHVAAMWEWTMPVPTAHWSAPLRTALRRNPLAAMPVAGTSDMPEDRLVRALIQLLYGQLPAARRALSELMAHPGAEAPVQGAATLATAVSVLLEGGGQATAPLLLSARQAEDGGLTWLGRQLRAVAAAGAQPVMRAELAAIGSACDAVGDTWGSALVALLHGVAELRDGIDPRPVAAVAERRLHGLGAGVLEAVAIGIGAVGAARFDDRASDLPARARATGRSTGSRWAQLLGALALGSSPEARGLADECGVSIDAVRSALLEAGTATTTDGGFGSDADSAADRAVVTTPVVPTPDAVTGLGRPAIRCLGGFALDGPAGEVDLTGLKPRPQELLRALAAAAGRPVPREVLIAALWPNADADGGLHNLHVAVSSLRRFLAEAVGDPLVVRAGPSYRIAAPECVTVDVLVFTERLAAARRSHDPAVRRIELEAALAVYTGDLLPDDAAAEWVTERRESSRAELVDAAVALADLLLATGLPRDASQACQAGLRVDRYRDDLWRLLIESLARSDDLAASARAELRYRAMLAELGVAVPVATPVTTQASGTAAAPR
ncbi:MAG TPA: AAA family ATPase [Actinopolymorphaceae bacterium]|jgi:DNA-binding SARP family transcriptional activator